MKTFLATIGALCLLLWAGVIVYALVNHARPPARRAKAPQTTEQMTARMAPFMVKASPIPQQRRRTFTVVDSLTTSQVDRLISLLQPCGVTPCGVCREHKPTCTASEPCCTNCPNSRPPAA